MSYIKFDKKQLTNLEYSLQREILLSNNSGSYTSTTIVGCNTRKYHGLLISPMPEVDNGKHVILSGLDETVIQHDKSFNLGIRKYPGVNVYKPLGHKYIRDFSIYPTPTITYRVGGVLLQKEIMLANDKNQVFIKYTLLDAHSKTTLRFNPFLAFRNVHYLSKSNFNTAIGYKEIENGVGISLYEPYKMLHMQFSKEVTYVPVPHWYYNIEYLEESKRGYEDKEDLYVPGYFELDIKKGETVIFSASLEEEKAKGLKSRFANIIKKKHTGEDYKDCLVKEAKLFTIKDKEKSEIIAGFPWFGSWGRDTFISLPGLTLAIDDTKTFVAVIKSMIDNLRNGLFTNVIGLEGAEYNSADTSLWFFWAMQKYAKNIKSNSKVWKAYKKTFVEILTAYKNGTDHNIKMQENGLIYAAQPGKALTWMDAIIDGKPVTQRAGYAVEINALWYNAVSFALQMAKESKDNDFIAKWKDLPSLIKKSFVEIFWDKNKGYLADFVNENEINWDIRPNQIFAISLPFSPIEDDIKNKVIKTVKNKLLTNRGLRTLTPTSSRYKGEYSGNQQERDAAYHQGTVWPWLLGHYTEAYLKLHGKSAVHQLEKLYLGFEDDLDTHGLCTLSEVYDGDPPRKPKGAISQAWSVAEIIRMKKLIDSYK